MTPRGPDRDGEDDREGVEDVRRVAALAALPGLGEKSAAMLVGVGVGSPDDLDRLGPVAVYLRLRGTYPGVSRNFLHVLEAIDAGCTWREVSRERKRQLDAEVAAAEAAEAERPAEGGAAS